MPFPDLSPYPVWMQVLFIGIFAIVAGGVFALVKSGFSVGKKTPLDKNQGAATVAAVIVDPAALDRLTGEVAGLNGRLTEIQLLIQGRLEGAPIPPIISTLGRLVDLVGQYVADQRDQREEREKEAAEDRGYQRGKAEGRVEGLRDRTPARKPPAE